LKYKIWLNVHQWQAHKVFKEHYIRSAAASKHFGLNYFC